MLTEWVKHQIIRSPLQRSAESLRDWSAGRRLRRHPELENIFREGERTRAVLAASITDGMHCLDVGCHLGSVLREFIRLSPSGRHLAIEPLPYKAAWLRRSYPEVDVVEAAVTEEEGEVEFSWNRSRSGFSSIAADRPKNDTIQRVVVRTQSLDAIVPPDRKIGFMKVDTEGAELMAFRSAQRILTEDRPTVLFECARRSTEAMGFQVEQVFAVLTERYDYTVTYLHEHLGDRTPLSMDEFVQSMRYPFQAFNFVATPRDR